MGTSLAGGIDIGSLTAKAVIVDEEGVVVASAMRPTGANASVVGEAILEEVLAGAGIGRDDLTALVATGYGRISIPHATKTVTEITCHARGAHHLFPATRTVIDIGGQDSKVIRLSEKGGVEDFMMNDKCAAGSGRFLDVMARALEIETEELATYAERTDRAAEISSTCTVFAESEVVGLVARGAPVEEIVRGIHLSIVKRLKSLVRVVGLVPEITMTGGVARNRGVVSLLTESLGAPVNVPEEPLVVGALGAALIASSLGRGA